MAQDSRITYPNATAAAAGGVSVGTLAALLALTPTAGQVGEPSDSAYSLLCRVDGTWVYRLHDYDVTPPPSAGWSAYNSGTSAFRGGQLVLDIAASTAALAYEGITRAAPAGDYHIIIGLTGDASGGAEWGFMWKNNLSTKFIVLVEQWNRSLNYQKHNATSSWNSHYLNVLDGVRSGQPYWWGIQFVNGVSKSAWWSTDRFTTKALLSTAADTDWIDPDLVGIVAYNTSPFPFAAHCWDWEEGSGALPGVAL